jgi:hypothetical protein
MNIKKLFVVIGILVGLVILAGFGTGFFITSKLEENLGVKKTISGVVYSPKTFKSTIGFFSGEANIRSVEISNPKVNIIIPNIDLSASLSDFKVDIKESIVTLKNLPKVPIKISNIYIQNKTSELSDMEKGISPNISIDMIEFQDKEFPLSATDISLRLEKVNQKEWGNIVLKIKNIVMNKGKGEEKINLTNIIFNNINRKGESTNLYDLNYQLEIEEIEFSDSVDPNSIKEPFSGSIKDLRFSNTILVTIKDSQSLVGLFKDLRNYKKNPDILNIYDVSIKKIETSLGKIVINFEQESSSFSLDKLRLNFDETSNGSQSISKFISSIEGIKGEFDKEGISIGKIAINTSGSIDKSIIEKLLKNTEFEPKDLILLFDVFENLKGEGSLLLDRVDIHSNKGNYSIDNYTFESTLSGQDGNISFSFKNNVKFKLLDEQKVFFSPVKPPDKVGITMELGFKRFDISNFRQLVTQYVINNKEPQPKESIRAVVKSIIKKPEIKLNIGLDLESFSKLLVSSNLSIKKDLPKNLTVDRTVDYIETKGTKGFTEFLKLLAELDVKLTIDNYKNPLIVADKMMEGQASMLFKMYQNIFVIKDDTVNTHLNISDKGSRLNGKQNEITTIIDSMI